MNRRFALIQALVSLVALGAVIWWASNQDAPKLPHGTHAYALLALGLGLYAVATLVRSERWHQILHLVGVRAKRSDSYSLTCVGYMGNNVLPARAGDILKVVLLSRRAEAGKRELLGTMVAERILDAIALAVIFTIVAFGILRDTSLPSDRPYLIGGIALALVAVAVVAFEIARRKGMLGRVRDFLRPLAGAPRALLSRTGVALLAASFAIWATEASVYLTVAHATGLDISAMGALYLMALANLFSMLPAAPGYVGTFDAAVIFGVKAIGGTKSAALPYLLLLRFILFVPITLVGLVLLVVRYGGWSRVRTAVRLEATRA
jgi:glycosyltransferase 2 family protein